MWWILKENFNMDEMLPTTIVTENELILKMNDLKQFYKTNKEDIKNYFIQQGTTNVSSGILANLIFSFFATMRSNDYIVVPHKNVVKCAQIVEDSFEHSTSVWSWKIRELLSVERDNVPEEINKYIRTPRILVTVDNEALFTNYFVNGGSSYNNTFEIPLDLNNAGRKALITIPSDITASEKERLKNLLGLYLL